MKSRDMELVIIRHGQTPGNAKRRYVGAVDEPLSELGREQARDAGSYPEISRVYVSTLARTHETAAIMFPNAAQVVVEGVQEMDFGVFAGRTAAEMEDDEQYREWVDSYCMSPCPGGEDRDGFTRRVCSSLASMLREAFARGEERVILVAHGGTMMAALDTFGDGSRSYYDWHVGNCEGYLIAVDLHDPSSLEGISFAPVASGAVADFLHPTHSAERAWVPRFLGGMQAS